MKRKTKAKCIAKKTENSYKFFLLMIVPILIGAFIALTSLTHAAWDRKEQILLKSPLEQGWVEVKGD